jgi:CheY-like chemotaxis protein
MLVFLDLEMPVMDGYGVLRHMEKQGIRPSKIVITGSRAGLNSERGIIGQKVRGAYSHPEDIVYLPKPVSVEELTQAASEALGIPLGD